MAKQTTLGMGEKKQAAKAVECLGKTFESDAARRAHFTEILRQKLADPAFRATPGFPKATDEAILRLSDPPYYTACPNPFIPDWLRATKSGPAADPGVAVTQPFQTDVQEGKSDSIYGAHSYHTKVPHRAIVRYILHYTNPGDVVLDAFCGSGQTGVAAVTCGSPDAELKAKVESELGRVRWGARRCVLADLAPAATFIAHNYNHPPDAPGFERSFHRVLSVLEADTSSLYDPPEGDRFSYGVWTDCFLCPECSSEIEFWDAAVDEDDGSVDANFSCPQCGAQLSKAGLDRVIQHHHDPVLGRVVQRGKYVLSMVNVGTGRDRVLRRPTEEERALAARFENKAPRSWHPADAMLFRDGAWGDMYRAGYHTGVSHAHHFFTARNLHALAEAWRLVTSMDEEYRSAGRYVFTGTVQIASRMSRFRFDSRNPKNTAGGIMNGVLFVPSMSKEARLGDLMERRFDAVSRQFAAQAGWRGRENVLVSTASATSTGLPDNSVDYVFIDPPFGKNIIYSELSFLWEAWLQVFTDQRHEAIMSSAQAKGLVEYQRLMQGAFSELYRVLKPGRWMTLVFSNSQNSVWRAIQESLGVAGFVVADIRMLDKKQRSFKQVTSSAVKQDLVISAYKPTEALTTRFELGSASASDAWDFVREHLRNVPIFADRDGDIEVVMERTAQTLHDRMIAFFVQRGVSVPLSGPEFFDGLDQRFSRRDGMYFLPDQVTVYDKKRALGGNVRQLSLFVMDEATAIRWLRQALDHKPQAFQDLQPQFMKAAGSWAKHERTVELKDLLRENFLHYDGNGEVPAPIHSYLSTNLKLRNLDKSHPELREAGRDRWYVPSVHRQGDLDQLRLRGLLKEFEEYKVSTQRKIKQFRTEAVRAGFKAAYDARDYRTIVGVAAKLPDEVVQEDEKLLMYVDVAIMRYDAEQPPTLFPQR